MLGHELPARGRGESGQALILMLLAITVIFAMGAIALDFGLWLTERQGAQKDADSSSMAGAYELLRQHFADPADNDPSSIRGYARDAVYDWVGLNGLDAADVARLDVQDTDCLGPSPVIDSVSVAAEHRSPALFTSIFGGVAPEIGAPAKACVGSIYATSGVLPVAIQTGGPRSDCWADLDGDGFPEPRLGRTCDLDFGDGESNHATSVRLDDSGYECSARTVSGFSQWRRQVANGGAGSECHVYNYLPDRSRCGSDPGGCVYLLPGLGSDNTLVGFQQLLSNEGDCDRRFGDRDGKDEFREIVVAASGAPNASANTVFLRRECTSPRLLTLVVVDSFPEQPSQPIPVEAFATFLLEGCETEERFEPRCEDDDDGIPDDGQNDRDDDDGDDGQFRLRGSFIDLYSPSGGAIQISKWSPKRIILVE